MKEWKTLILCTNRHPFWERSFRRITCCVRSIWQNVLLVYGGGSIKRNGLYQQITDLPKNGHTLIELSGVEPNPRIETVRKGIELCKETKSMLF